MLPALTDPALPKPVSESGTPRWSSQQIAVAAFVGLLLLTAIATAAYLFGRMANTSPDPKSDRPERLIVVDPPAAPKAGPESRPVSEPRGQAAAPALVPARPASTEPLPAANYFQVAATEQGMADVSVEYLKQKGFAAVSVPGPTPLLFRVLVGPLDDSSAAETKLALEKLGFRPFLKRQ